MVVRGQGNADVAFHCSWSDPTHLGAGLRAQLGDFRIPATTPLGPMEFVACGCGTARALIGLVSLSRGYFGSTKPGARLEGASSVCCTGERLERTCTIGGT